MPQDVRNLQARAGGKPPRHFDLVTEAKIEEHEIAPLAQLKSTYCAMPLDLDGRAFAGAGLVFRGFAGKLSLESGLYEGSLRFDFRAQPGDHPVDVQEWIGVIPGVAAAAPAPQEEKVATEDTEGTEGK